VNSKSRDANRPALQPTDSFAVPRYAGLATFMRMPYDPDPADIEVGIVGVPFDLGSSFRSGSREGPAAIREASRGVRLANPGSGVRPYELVDVADVGDIGGNPYDAAATIDQISSFVRRLADDAIWPLALGGDHGITLPILRGLAPFKPIGVLQFDAHLDTFDEFHGSKFNNGTWLRRAHEEGLVDGSRTVQLGLRSWSNGSTDFAFSHDARFTVITHDDYEDLGREETITRIRSVLGDGPVYVSFDIDALDIVEAPGCAGRVPGGLSMRDAQVILRGLTGCRVIAGDVNEVAPWLDPAGITQVNAAYLTFEILCLMAVARARVGRS
jgi:guanidinopropionase